MDDKLANMIIQEIHILGKNISELDKKVDSKFDKVNDRVNSSMENHADAHIECKKECVSAMSHQVSTTGRFFRWSMGFVIVALLAVAGLAGSNQVAVRENNILVKNQVTLNAEKLEQINDQIKRDLAKICKENLKCK